MLVHPVFGSPLHPCGNVIVILKFLIKLNWFNFRNFPPTLWCIQSVSKEEAREVGGAFYLLDLVPHYTLTKICKILSKNQLCLFPILVNWNMISISKRSWFFLLKMINFWISVELDLFRKRKLIIVFEKYETKLDIMACCTDNYRTQWLLFRFFVRKVFEKKFQF